MPARRLSTLMMLAALASPVAAQTPTAPVTAPRAPLADAEAHRPTSIPDRIIRTIAADPSRSIAVTWRTDTTVAGSVAQVAPAEHGPRFLDKARTVPAASQDVTTNLGPARHHSAVVDGLEPSTSYVYRVGDGVEWSEWFEVRTAAAGAEPFRFIYLGDAQNNLRSMWSRVIRRAYADAPDAAFIVHAGDLVNRGANDAEWGEWFAAGGWINGVVPSVPSIGNHEYDRPRLPDGTAVPGAKGVMTAHWRAQFALPDNGPKGLEETAYYFDYQGMRVVSLNSSEGQREQAEWLDRVLADNPQAWTVVTFHHPIYSPAERRDNADLRTLWQPIFDRHKVDIVMQGHDHTYARTGLQSFDAGETADGAPAAPGTVYVVSVAGPKQYALEHEPWMRRAGEDVQLYQIITVDGGVLRYEARTATGQPYDGFELHKQPDGRPNVLVERVPDVPEIRRAPAPARAAAN